MPSSIACPSCSARLHLPDQLPEHITVLRCPQCKAAIPVDQLASLRAQSAPPAQKPAKPAARTSMPGRTEVAADSAPPKIDDLNLEIGDEDRIEETQAAEELVSVEAGTEEDELAEVEAADDELVDVDGVEDDELVDVEAEEAVEVDVIEEEDEPASKLRSLLGRQEFILRSKFGLVNLKYDVLDGKSRKKIGTALEETSALRHMVGMGMFGRGTRKDVSNQVILRDNKERVLAVLKRTVYWLRPPN